MDANTTPTDDQVAAARAIVAEADARIAADRQAKAEAASTAVRQLVKGAAFRAALVEMEAALEVAPKNTELAYAVTMMDRLVDTFDAPAA